MITSWIALALSEGVPAELERTAPALQRASGAPRDAPQSAELDAVGMLVADRLGVEAAVGRHRDSLLASQRPDGGWGFLPGDPSNPMTTGQGLYALSSVAGTGGAEPARGAAPYLVDRCDPEGGWTLPSRMTSRTPSAARDDVYGHWASAWAVLGLVAWLETSSPSARSEVDSDERSR